MSANILTPTDARLDVDGKLHSELPGHRFRLRHHVAQHFVSGFVARHLLERRQRQDAHRVERQVAPELQPNVVSNAIAHRCFETASGERFAQRGDALRFRSVRLSEHEALPVQMPYDAGLHDLTGRIHDASHRPLRTEPVPDAPAWIGNLEPLVLPGTVELVKVPPENSVLGSHHCRVRSEQWDQTLHDGRDRVRLQRDDDEILLAQLGWIVGYRRADDFPFVAHPEGEAIFSHRLEVRAPCDEADVVATESQLGAQIAADGSRAVDANLQGRSETSGKA